MAYNKSTLTESDPGPKFFLQALISTSSSVGKNSFWNFSMHVTFLCSLLVVDMIDFYLPLDPQAKNLS